MTSPEYQAPTWVNEDHPDFVEGVSPDLGAGYLNALSGAVEDHGQRLGAAESNVANLQATALDQADGDARYILQANANGFAPADATTTALAGKVAKSANLSDLASAATARTNLGLAAAAASGKLADLTDVTTTGAAVGQDIAVAQVNGGVPTWKTTRRVFNVRDFGAAGDGTADDTAEIQAALDAAAAAGSAEVLVPEGTYKVSASLTIDSNVILAGTGPGSLIFAAPATNAHVLVNADPTGGNTGIVVRDLAFDARRAGQTTEVNALDFTRVTRCLFDNLDVQGGRRNNTYPNGTNGEGIALRYSDRNEIRGGRYHDNDYDGIKLRGSDYNRIVAPSCVDNGRSGVQISFNSPTGPPFNVNEGVLDEGSNYNVLIGVVVENSTGIPTTASPTTSGIYIHTGAFNQVIGAQIYGVRQGFGLYAGALDNEFIGGLVRIRYVDRAAIDLDGGTPASSRNSFTGVKLRALSGVDGKHVRILAGNLTRFYGCYFSRGDGTGTWTQDCGGADQQFLNTYTDGTFTDVSNEALVWGPTNDFGDNIGFGAGATANGGKRVIAIQNAVTAPSTSPALGGVLYAQGGVLKWRGNGAVFSAGQQAAIASPTADVTALKTAVDALRTALQTAGLIAP